MEWKEAPKQPVAVIGAGVSGLTVASYLIQEGYPVKILANKIGTETTSVIAGALWELPHAVCGHADAEENDKLDDLEKWSMFSYYYFSGLIDIEESGVYFKRVHFYSDKTLVENPALFRKIKLLKTFARGIEIHEEDIPEPYCFHYSYLAPMVDMDVYLNWLIESIKEQGGRIERCCVTPDELKDIESFKAKHEVEWVVNCSGLGAAELSADENVFPVRGAWFLFPNDGSVFPKVEAAHCTTLTDHNEHFIFVLPRGEEKLIIGGTATPNISTTEMELDDPLLVKMFQNSISFLPELQNLTPASKSDFRVGLRPFRSGSVRLEMDENAVVHNYGHGGSGVLLSWGCANAVFKLMREFE